ncbi:anti-sigma factor [Psychrobacillus sp. MER TA 171]|uniref:anti-sigma factor n=1 Tax=Psychrobacillus sp. MER TA 171 TaxID=2939577 RepID=UPI00203FFB23|nr:anti-sigma factor [Psychrobacillus sp. MER TA 171]MCM3359653.1 anti-sigma factor [Psychrobacillus sp. MER TA 171]
MEWNDDKAKAIVQKHKKRFSWKLSFNVIRVLLGIVLVYAIYMISVSIIYDATNVGKRNEFYQKLAVDWTYPGYTSSIFFDGTNEINPFLTQKIEFPLIKIIGKEEFAVTKFSLNKPLIDSYTAITVDEYFPYNTDNKFSFSLPYNPVTNEKLDETETPDVWNQLVHIHEGNVAQLAFSTNRYYSPEELLELVSNYQVDVLWMPVYMGELKNFTEGGWSGSENDITLAKPWGLAGFKHVDEDFNITYSTTNLNTETVKESQEIMLKNMGKMIEEDRNLAETLLGTAYLQERYDYLQKEGFQVYGAVVTGPVKELLKLKEIEGIHNAKLGEIKPWNWIEQ